MFFSTDASISLFIASRTASILDSILASHLSSNISIVGFAFSLVQSIDSLLDLLSGSGSRFSFLALLLLAELLFNGLELRLFDLHFGNHSVNLLFGPCYISNHALKVLIFLVDFLSGWSRVNFASVVFCFKSCQRTTTITSHDAAATAAKDITAERTTATATATATLACHTGVDAAVR
jgi:hypothetical protein